jgi:hypothetical protein
MLGSVCKLHLRVLVCQLQVTPETIKLIEDRSKVLSQHVRRRPESVLANLGAICPRQCRFPLAPSAPASVQRFAPKIFWYE